MTCPFLPPGLDVVREDRPELLLNVAHPAHARLYFLGFVQAHGPMIPCVESQMGLVADLIQVRSPHPQSRLPKELCSLLLKQAGCPDAVYGALGVLVCVKLPMLGVARPA